MTRSAGRSVWLAAGLALISPGLAAAQASPVGRWLTEGDKAVVEIMPCGAALCGTLQTILKPDPGAPTTDIHNPDPRLRHRSTGSLTILNGFVADDARWHGRVYDPRSGRTYKSFIEVRPDGTLALSGCVWMLCQTQNWRRSR